MLEKTDKRKVLILIGDVGGGHMAPAQAIKYIFEQDYPAFEVEIVDLFTKLDIPPFNNSESSYSSVTNNYFLQAANDVAFRLFNTGIGYKGFMRYALGKLYAPTAALISQIDPDIVITNNPIVTGVVGRVRKQVGGFLLVNQMTDLDDFFRPAADNNADLVISPSDLATKRLERWGVNRDKIFGNYFSIRPQLQDVRPRGDILKELNFSVEKKTIVVMAGGLGFNKYLAGAVDDLIKHSDFQVVLMVGRLQGMAQNLEVKYEGNQRVLVQRFTDRVQDFYTIADVVIAKPGMSVVLECELFKKKTILTREVALQEVGNVKYALQSPRFRYIGSNWAKLRQMIDELLGLDLRDIPSRRSFEETKIIVDKIVGDFKTTG